MKILVSGANGQLGKCLHDVSKMIDHAEFIFLGRDHFAIDQFGMVRQILHELKPDWVINAAAYTAVDKAEAEVEYAMLINGESVGHLAASCKDVGARLVHVSTDYVFDGEGKHPYKEDDVVNPIGAYGRSKLMGEQLAMQANPDTAIVRTSWVYSRHGSNFVKTMLRLMKEKESIGVVNDQLGSPTYAVDLAQALISICTHQTFVPGIYHYCNRGVISWYDFAVAIQQLSGYNCQVNPISTAEFPTPAKRPAWSVLDCTKILKTYACEQPDWRASLEKCIPLILA